MTGRELEVVRREAPGGEGTAELLAALARLAAGAWLRTAGWGLGTSMRLARMAAAAG